MVNESKRSARSLMADGDQRVAGIGVMLSASYAANFTPPIQRKTIAIAIRINAKPMWSARFKDNSKVRRGLAGKFKDGRAHRTLDRLSAVGMATQAWTDITVRLSERSFANIQLVYDPPVWPFKTRGAWTAERKTRWAFQKIWVTMQLRCS